jgi:hypothetical protein
MSDQTKPTSSPSTSHPSSTPHTNLDMLDEDDEFEEFPAESKFY